MIGPEGVVLLIAAALFTDFFSLLPPGLHLMGWGKGRPVWTILFIGGLVQFLLATATIFGAGDVLVGFIIAIFGVIFTGIGFMVHRGYDPAGVGHLALATAVPFVVFAIYFAAVYGGAYGWVWFIIMLSITAILLIVALMDYGKLSERATGISLVLWAVWFFLLGAVMFLGYGLDTFTWITGL